MTEPGVTDRSTSRTEPFEDLDAIALTYAARMQETSRSKGDLRDQMARQCLPFAGRLARRYAGHGEPLADLEQVASLGLIKAIDRYDPERGSFTAYAVTTITGELKRHFRDKTWGVHVTRRMKDLGRDVKAATAAMTSEMARTPTTDEVAERIGADPTDVREAMESFANYTPTSLNSPIGAGDRVTELGELVGEDDPDLESLDDRITVADLIRHLPEREQRLLSLRFYGNLTQADIAAQLGISQMHVSRLLSRTFAWLREALLSDSLPGWDVTTGQRSRPHLLAEMVHTDDKLTLIVRGEVDRDTSGLLRAQLRHAIQHGGRPLIVVDIAEVPLIDAAGIAALSDAAVACERAGVTLTITGAQPYVAPLLAVCGLGPRRPS